MLFIRVYSTRLLNEATGSLLDDVQLVNTLQTSKLTATEVSEQLESSEQTEIEIDSAREVRCMHEGYWGFGSYDKLNTFRVLD